MPNDGNETFDMEHLLELAEEKKYRLLKEELVELNEVDIASFIEELDSERTVIVFRMLPKALATEVFAELPVDKQSHIINSITDKELSEIVDELYVDDAVDLVEELPATVVRRVLQNTKPETRKLINQFLNYPENSAGSIMTAEYIGLKSGCSRANKASESARRVSSYKQPADTVCGHCADRLKHRISGMESAFRYFFLTKSVFGRIICT